jgi:demethylmenaquinone methyltransferase/2-methoxy-6-polyprenyl-1,4-benzoquinol methylase
MNFCDLKAGQKILDVACGTGVLFKALLAYSPECVLGVDISERMVQKALEKVKDNRLKVIAQDFLELDANEFDRVVIYNAYPHFFDKDKLAKKTFEVLRSGGRFILAHNMGRKMINAVHDKNKAGKYSTTLNSADTEKCWFEPWFTIDKCVDTDDSYIITGTKA